MFAQRSRTAALALSLGVALLACTDDDEPPDTTGASDTVATGGSIVVTPTDVDLTLEDYELQVALSVDDAENELVLGYSGVDDEEAVLRGVEGTLDIEGTRYYVITEDSGSRARTQTEEFPSVPSIGMSLDEPDRFLLPDALGAGELCREFRIFEEGVDGSRAVTGCINFTLEGSR